MSDISMFTEKEEVVPVRERALCGECGTELEDTGERLDVYPPRFTYYCPNCEKEIILDDKYPQINFVSKE